MALGDFLRSVFSRAPKVPPVTRQYFSTYPVDQLLLHMQKKVGQVGRDEALSVPAVLRGRNLICSISTLPLEAVDAANEIVDHPLLRQIDPNTANVVTLAQTVEDLVFSGVSWWRITEFGWDNYPTSAVRYAPDQVTSTPPKDYTRGYLPSGLATESSDEGGNHNGPGMWMGGEWVPTTDIIRFDSPNPALLVAGQAPICRSVALNEAAQLFAENPRMRGFFTPKDPNAELNPDTVLDALDAWQLSRQERVDGFIPAALDYQAVQDATPADLQLVAMQEKASKDIANALGIDPEDLGLNTTSRTYQNQVDRRKDRINDTLAPYMAAVTQRLGMPDVTKRGVRVRFNLDDYLKADPKTRAEVQQIYADLGVTDAAEIREKEGLPPRIIMPPLRAAYPTPVSPNVRVDA